MSQSDVSKLERRDDARLSTLRRLAAALGGTLTARIDSPAGPAAVELPEPPPG
ncbi:MAG: helix-turn-helix domain-containing protein [Egibacteraceae bacterium]